jgi:hypothetical protein
MIRAIRFAARRDSTAKLIFGQNIQHTFPGLPE